MTQPALVTLIRHGETPANVDGVWHGSTDTPLTALGQRQAERVGLHVARTRPDISALYASPLQRAQRTARPLGERLGLAVGTEDDLREYHLGEWEGVTYRELNKTHRLFERMNQDPDWCPGGGESARAVALRLAGAIQRIAERHPGERIGIVTHGGALTLALGWLVDGDPSAWRRVVSNASVSELALHPEPVLRAFNQTAHLHGLA